MSEIKVHFGTIENAGTTVRQSANTIKAQLDDLAAGVAKIAASWSGVAQEGYQARQKEWDRKASDMHTTLMSIADALDHAHQSYTHTEDNNRRMWEG
jgi:early secretory antigenic target protein ESAT-6